MNARQYAAGYTTRLVRGLLVPNARMHVLVTAQCHGVHLVHCCHNECATCNTIVLLLASCCAMLFCRTPVFR